MGRYSYNAGARNLNEDVPLVTAEEVLLICEEAEDATGDQMVSFINTAHTVLADEIDGWGVSGRRLHEIELYLAAHFAAITFPVASFESVGKVQVSYQNKVKAGLDYTKYGQAAKRIDPTGQLARLDDDTTKTKRYGAKWMGFTMTERVDGGLTA